MNRTYILVFGIIIAFVSVLLGYYSYKYALLGQHAETISFGMALIANSIWIGLLIYAISARRKKHSSH